MVLVSYITQLETWQCENNFDSLHTVSCQCRRHISKVKPHLLTLSSSWTCLWHVAFGRISSHSFYTSKEPFLLLDYAAELKSAILWNLITVSFQTETFKPTETYHTHDSPSRPAYGMFFKICLLTYLSHHWAIARDGTKTVSTKIKTVSNL